jgi:hypothetical protein
MKSGPIQVLHTLNWRWNVVVKRGTRSLFDDRGDWSARTKVEAALAYARHIREVGLAYPVDDGTIPVEVRVTYVGDGPPTPEPSGHGDEY